MQIIRFSSRLPLLTPRTPNVPGENARLLLVVDKDNVWHDIQKPLRHPLPLLLSKIRRSISTCHHESLLSSLS